MSDVVMCCVRKQNAGRHCTAMDNLPRLPRLALKKSGQRKPNKHAMPRLPRHAPTQNNKGEMKSGVFYNPFVGATLSIFPCADVRNSS